VSRTTDAQAGNVENPSPSEAGNFDRWARTIGGILDHVGILGFLTNAHLFDETANREPYVLFFSKREFGIMEGTQF
jgi:hypothetical protein